MYQTAIYVEGLVKRYGSQTAVDSIGLTVPKGRIFALLGPNGAGKTSTLEMIEGLRKPDEGKIVYFERKTQGIDDEVRGRIGVQLQSSDFFPYLTVEEVLRTFAGLYARRTDIGSLMTRFLLTEKRRSQTRTLSGGQKQRLALALALVNEPEVVFLDEPTTGLDTQSRLSLWAAVRQLKAEGRTVVLTTHYMEEADALADSVAIMDHGKVVAAGNPQELCKQYGCRNLEDLFLTLTGNSLRD